MFQGAIAVVLNMALKGQKNKGEVMSRRKAAPKRPILPDPLFGSELLTRFTNVVMRHGKKSIAEQIVYGALETLVKRRSSKLKKEEGDEKGGGVMDSIRVSVSARKFALDTFEQVLDHLRPTVEVHSRRVGGATYQVPVEVRPSRRTTLAMRWLVEYANERGEKTMELRLAGEMLDALEGRGGAVKKREDVHRMAKANQAFAHYRW